MLSIVESCIEQISFQLFLKEKNSPHINYPTFHHRYSIRLKGYDYSQAGFYFITICTQKRQPLLGKIINGQMELNEYGQIANQQWQKIPERFENIELDEFVIMPNHIHGILIIHDPEPVGAGFTPALDDESHNTRVGASPTPTKLLTGQPQGLPLPKTVGDIVGAYKSIVANECLKLFKSKNQPMGKLWQRNYYEHIIRNEKSYLEIVQYILDNPIKWESDRLYPGGTP